VYYNFIDDSFDDFLKEIKKLKGKKYIYMFSIDNKVSENLFAGIKDLTIEPIPQMILDVYKKLVPFPVSEFRRFHVL
jgi:adenine-specific DNA-methyltransferase